MNKFGIMQGRLTNKEGFFPQQFPWENWKKEFYLSQSMDLQCIEWMFNSEKYQENPIWNQKLSNEIRELEIQTDISIESVCMNYFMQNSLMDSDIDERETNVVVLQQLLQLASDLDIKYAVLPLFEKGCPLNEEEENILIHEIKSIYKDNQSIKTQLAIECDWQAEKILSFIQSCNTNKIKVCYDLGNAVGAGYDVLKEIYFLNDYIVNIHIKDKKIRGTSVLLGKGDVNFAQCFRALRDIHYYGNFILESYFGSNAICDTQKNYLFIRETFQNSLK